MIGTEQIKQQGYGQGAGDIVDALPRQKIIELIKEECQKELWLKAFNARIEGKEDGYCFISLEIGNIYAYSMGDGESNQACDNNEIEIFCIDKNINDLFGAWSSQNEYSFVEECLKKEKEFEGIDWEEDSFYIRERCLEINESLLLELEKEWEDDSIAAMETPEIDWDSIHEQLDGFYNFE